jgi:hypothetical protein
MIAVLVVNLLLVACSVVLDNAWLMEHGYLLYAAQALTLLPYLAWRVFYVHHLFMPSVFALAYYLVNLTLGGYLVPRDFGWNKDYTDVARGIEHYQVIVPYLLAVNVVLFLLTCHTVRQLATPRAGTEGRSRAAAPLAVQLVTDGACIGAFVLTTMGGVFFAYAFQLAILILHLTYLLRQDASRRYLIYAVYLLAFVGSNFGNKREIVMVLFLMVFLEAWHRRERLRFTVRTVMAGAGLATTLMGTVLTASILRGYGGFDPESLAQALRFVPRYVTSDVFVDGVTDNLELNYNYGSTVTSIAMVIDGRLPYQWGASLWKVLWLPVPRTLVPEKPQSTMQLYTQEYAPELWADEGSLPVAFSSEMFVNFGPLGLVPFALIWAAINRLYRGIDMNRTASFGLYSRLFLVMTILMFARGSGLEQWLLYFVVAAPLLWLVAVLQRRHDAPMPAMHPGAGSTLPHGGRA